MEGIIDTANRAMVQNERDFIQDGLIYCGVCGGIGVMRHGTKETGDACAVPGSHGDHPEIFR